MRWPTQTQGHPSGAADGAANFVHAPGASRAVALTGRLGWQLVHRLAPRGCWPWSGLVGPSMLPRRNAVRHGSGRGRCRVADRRPAARPTPTPGFVQFLKTSSERSRNDRRTACMHLPRPPRLLPVWAGHQHRVALARAGGGRLRHRPAVAPGAQAPTAPLRWSVQAADWMRCPFNHPAPAACIRAAERWAGQAGAKNAGLDRTSIRPRSRH